MAHLTSTTIPRKGIAFFARTHRRRIEYLVTLDARPPWSSWLMRSIEVNVAEDPIKSDIPGHPIKIEIEFATHIESNLSSNTSTIASSALAIRHVAQKCSTNKTPGVA